jgi:uracil-DNA glycosylase
MKKDEFLAQVEKNIKNCKQCRLYKDALNAVPGEGNLHPDIAFIGEAPGRNEDETGRPFVGRAGKLLEASLEKIGYKREDIWIGNVIKHRPPQNRDPLPDEIAACKGYLTFQLKALAPKLIVTLGRFAMNYFYPEGKISLDRGRVITIDSGFVFPVYHPAAALRNGKMHAAFTEDFLKIPGVLKDITDGVLDSDESLEEVEEIADGQLSLL